MFFIFSTDFLVFALALVMFLVMFVMFPTFTLILIGLCIWGLVVGLRGRGGADD